MANLKSLKIKSKEYIFKAFENDKEPVPAKVVFSRFPAPGESFALVNYENLFEGVDAGKIDGRETQDAISKKIVNRFINNLGKGAFDYRRFTDECVDHIENFEYEGRKIITPTDFWQILPVEAAYMIAKDLHEYANERDEFTMGESKA
jgi:hypothetical protein